MSGAGRSLRRRFARLLDRLLAGAAAERVVFGVVRLWASTASRRPPADGLRALLRLDDLVVGRIDQLAIQLDAGVHAKHRLIGYHDFFVAHVARGEAVLDVGCGKGELAHDLVTRAGARVTGIDVNPRSLEFAEARFGHEDLQLVNADVLEWQPTRDQSFDTVVLSNVLEHIAPRVELLRRLREVTGASRFLIRVPSWQRDWLVPLREELGLSTFGDPTHETEYTVEQFEQELRDAGLEIVELVQRWGELWAAARPAAGDGRE